MDVAAFCRETRVWVVAGKGGVGKTTVAASLARMAADSGLTVLVIELEGKPVLPAAFGSADPLGYDTRLLWPPAGDGGEGAATSTGTVSGRRITPDDALLEYLADHGLQRVSKRLVSTGVLDVVATAIPGIRDVLVLGKVKQLERAGSADLIVVDAPATGHAMTFLASASGLLDAARSGPVRSQASDVVELLRDPSRCRVILVTLPEEMPVSETVEAAYQLEDRVGVQLGPVVVNGWEELPDRLAGDVDASASEAGITLSTDQRAALDAARVFRVRRCKLAAEQVSRLARDLPLPQLRLPRLIAPAIGPGELARLAAAFATEVGKLAPEEDAA